ncbi:MAG: response regulator transcription factor [Lachnospiraceae bacterium]|nr:response regulator transcription factor [Lachnospiraceae bacterium]
MRILLAEDEASMARALTVILEKNHYSVEQVDNGADALDYALIGDYDAIILDWMMPKMDGVTVLKKLRAKGKRTPVLMLTARAEVDDRVLGLDSGADDYLTKPFAAKELLARIRVMTRQAAPSPDTKMRYGNISLDSASFELAGPGGSMVLPNKEYQMLEMLLRHPGHVVSADRFMDRIWGLETDTDQSVVWVNISYLRKKLASTGANVVIKVQRNEGYFVTERGDA